MHVHHSPLYSFFFFNDTATTEIYTLSLHDALPISRDGDEAGLERLRGAGVEGAHRHLVLAQHLPDTLGQARPDRKSTRLNSSHVEISYAVFCLKKKKKTQRHTTN